jgi:CRP-like cAMP-binding protein
MNTTSRSAPPFSFISPLHSRDVFQGLPQNVRDALSRSTKTAVYREGDTIFEEGEMPIGILRIEKGKARLSFIPGGQKARQSRLLEEDEIWGLTEILSESPMEVALQSTEPTVIEIIPAEEFIRLLRKENSLCFRLLRLLSSRYQARWTFFEDSEM